MGMSTKSVSFVDDRLAIVPDECSPKYVNYLRYSKKLSLRVFGKGRRVNVEEVVGTNEFIFRSEDGVDFAMGRVAR